jgi:tRNA pseudouridine55 synthase
MAIIENNSEGFLLIDKPRGPSSFTVVAAVRRALKTKKTGHAGTLDPGASGLLVIAVGPYTRLLPYLPLEPKVYRFSVRFGVATDTLDSEGAVTRSGGRIPSADKIEKMLPGFTGTIRQTPPMFSAVKVGGERSYALARRGEQVELAARTVEIAALRLLEFDESAGVAELETTCSGGTYVRSLARDIALKLGTFGHASSIRRTAIGRFCVDRALEFSKIAEAERAMLKAGDMLDGLPRVLLTDAQMARIMTGKDIACDPSEIAGSPELLFACDQADRLVAVLKRAEGKTYHPEKVFL